MRIAHTLSLLFFIASLTCAQRPERYSRVKIHFSDLADAQRAAALGIPLDHGNGEPGTYFITELSATEIGLLRTNGFQTDDLIDDVSRFYVDRNRAPSGSPKSLSGCGGPLLGPTPAHFTLGSVGGFYSLAELEAIIDSMIAGYPGLISPRTEIGQSIEGRSIYFVRMSNAPNVDQDKPEVLYDALHHAREPMGLAEQIHFMWYLLENYGTDPEVTYLLDHRELYFVPCVNPDGVVRNELTNPDGGGMWRKNRRNNGDGTYGVDLNRNYGWNWGYDNVGSSPVTSSDTYRGSGPFSEPETQAMRDFCLQREFRYNLSAHSSGNHLVFPWGYIDTEFIPDSAVIYAHGQDMERDNGYQFGNGPETVGYPANGCDQDWQYGEQVLKGKTYALVAEVGNGDDGFWPAISRIEPLCRGALTMDLMAAHVAGVHFEVRDHGRAIHADLQPWMRFELQRTGLDSAACTVSLEPVQNVLAVGSPLVFTGFELLETRTDSIMLDLDPAMADGDEFRYVLVVESDGYVQRDTITKVFGTPWVVFSDAADNMAAWQGQWSTTTARSYSPPRSFADSPSANYAPSTTRSMTLADPIDLGGASSAVLTFMAQWFVEAELDQVEVSASTNGVAWTPLCGRYTRPGTADQLLNQPVYDGKRATWVAEEMDLEAYLGESIQLRFRLVADAGVQYDGFYLDDVRVTITGSPAGLNEALATGQAPAYPNPADDHVMIPYDRPAGTGEIELVLTDAWGRIVHQHRTDPAGGIINLNTSALASGVYHYALRAHGSAQAGRLVITRP